MFEYFKQKGFTLIEVMVTLAIIAVLILGAATMLNDIFTNSSQELLSMSNIDGARSALSTFSNEIRNATIGSDGSFALNQAGDSQIIFYSNFRTGGVVARIRYYVSGNVLYKGVVLPACSPLAYNLSSESVRPVAEGITNGGTPVFYYYDGNYSGITVALSQPVNINHVRFVRVNLMVSNQITAKDTSTFPITTGAAIRSLKDNLGN